MIDKEKQIEVKRLVNIITKIYPNKYSIEYPAKAIRLANEILEHYEPKLPRDGMVLSREEYDDLIESKRLLGCYIEDQKILLQRVNSPDPFWFCTSGGCEGISKECKDTCEMSIFVKERKKTAKEIYQQLQEHGTTYVKKWIKKHFSIGIKE